MYYPDAKEYITFLFSFLDAFAEKKQTLISRGRPKTYSDAALIVFYAMMTLKQINTTRGQHRWLYTHPLMLETLGLEMCPSRSTLARRYKVLFPLLSEFSEFIADSAVSQVYGFSQTLVYEDKSLFRAWGPVWHKKDRAKNHIPKGLRNVDKTATWSKSAYHGWVYGYGLHLTTTRHGFPVMFDVLPASESDGVGGVRGNTFEYKQFNYTGILIENLTNPNRKFEYNGTSVEETPTTEPEIPEITFENVLDVVEGKRYRLRPTTISTDINREHLFITTAYWGNVDIDEKFIENGNFPADARKVRLFLAFDPPIHTYTPEDEIVIGYDGMLKQWDEIVIEVTSKPNIIQRVGELKNRPVTYLSVGFLCKPIENLTQPDRKFKYDEK